MDPQMIKKWTMKNYGCAGGRQDWTWQFIKANGAMWADQYPSYYSGWSGVEGTCEHDVNNTAVKVRDHYLIKPNPYTIREELKVAPLSIAIGVGNKLYGYASGVISKGDESYCTQSLNHAVTLVGY